MGFSNDHIHRESINRQLTARQIQILELVSKGFTNPEICNFLQISTNTVKVHLANISLPSIHFYLDHSIVQHALAYRFFNGIAVGIQKF